ncbi:MAG: hypothetical protein K8W52_03270 [Deltaproteobacteria bacterium]|nr:hypothetical protein [Deltaproteobacteria bacterium]
MTPSDRDVLEILSAGVLIADLREIVRYANPAAALQLHRRAADCCGQALPLLLGMSLPLADHDISPEQPEVRLEIEQDGATLGATIIRLAGRGYACVFRRVEDGRGADRQLLRVEREAAMVSMINSFAHEVRNPLASIQATVDYLRGELDAADPRREHLHRIERQIRRLSSLADGPLALGRVSSSQRVACEVAALIDTAVTAVAAQSAAQAIRISVAVKSDMPRVVVDEGDVVEALTELLDNAISASVRGSAVAVSHRVVPSDRGHAPRVVIEIEDAGLGMERGDVAQALRPFYTTKRGAAGVGLSLAQRFIQASGGRLGITTRAGVGTVLQVDLPGEEPA